MYTNRPINLSGIPPGNGIPQISALNSSNQGISLASKPSTQSQVYSLSQSHLGNAAQSVPSGLVASNGIQIANSGGHNIQLAGLHSVQGLHSAQGVQGVQLASSQGGNLRPTQAIPPALVALPNGGGTHNLPPTTFYNSSQGYSVLGSQSRNIKNEPGIGLPPPLIGNSSVRAASNSSVRATSITSVNAASFSSIHAASSLQRTSVQPVAGSSAVKVEHKPEGIKVSSVPAHSDGNGQPKEEDTPEMDIYINNVVCSFSVRCHLNLKEIALIGSNVEYRRENGMVTMKLRHPYTTASIWSSGKITCTGANTEDDAKIAARKFSRILQRLDPKYQKIRIKNWRIVNVLGTCNLPFGIKIVPFSQAFKEASYEPELHPGVTYKLKFPKATLKIFSTGSITVTAPSVANVQAAVEHIYPKVCEYQKPKDVKELENDAMRGTKRKHYNTNAVSEKSRIKKNQKLLAAGNKQGLADAEDIKE